MTETLYKCLAEGRKSCHGGNMEYPAPNGKRPGKWLPLIKDLEPCRHGYHVARVGDLMEWASAELWEVEVRGDRIDLSDKVVVGQVRLIRPVSDWQKIMRLFAADCAERALSLYGGDVDPRSWAAVDAARDHAHGRINDDQLAAAREAAWEAAWAAARAAAREAAWAADRAAAREAAWAAAWAADRAAAREAAREAAWDAEKQWQTQRLTEYLTLGVDDVSPMPERKG